MTEWKFSESGRAASYQSRGKCTEVEVDGDDLEVRVDEGRGYLSNSTVAYVPLDVVRRLLAGVPSVSGDTKPRQIETSTDVLYQRPSEAGKYDPCVPSPYSSAMCARGTKSCPALHRTNEPWVAKHPHPCVCTECMHPSHLRTDNPRPPTVVARQARFAADRAATSSQVAERLSPTKTSADAYRRQHGEMCCRALEYLNSEDRNDETGADTIAALAGMLGRAWDEGFETALVLPEQRPETPFPVWTADAFIAHAQSTGTHAQRKAARILQAMLTGGAVDELTSEAEKLGMYAPPKRSEPR